jgi:hypothetical protein
VADLFLEDAFSTPVAGLHAAIAAGEASFFRRLGSEYRRASRSFAGLLRGPLPHTATERAALTYRLQTIQEMQARCAEDEAYCASVLGEFWHGKCPSEDSLSHLSRLAAGT